MSDNYRVLRLLMIATSACVAIFVVVLVTAAVRYTAAEAINFAWAAFQVFLWTLALASAALSMTTFVLRMVWPKGTAEDVTTTVRIVLDELGSTTPRNGITTNRPDTDKNELKNVTEEMVERRATRVIEAAGTRSEVIETRVDPTPSSDSRTEEPSTDKPSDEQGGPAPEVARDEPRKPTDGTAPSQ